jgi:hypothetical protein
MRRVAILVAFALVAACSLLPGPPTVAWGDRVPEPDPAVVASQPVVARGPSSITLLPISPRGAQVGVAYRNDMPHCGILSPIDVDGSYWDAGAATDRDPVAFDGRTGTFTLNSPDDATFIRSDGATLDLVRHAGAKEFPLCS